MAGTKAGHDVIDISASIFANYAALKAGMTQVGTDVVLASGTDAITFKAVAVAVAVANLVAADVIFH